MVSEGSQTSLEPNWSETGLHMYVLVVCRFRFPGSWVQTLVIHFFAPPQQAIDST